MTRTRLGALAVAVWFFCGLPFAPPARAANDTVRVGVPAEPHSLNPLIAQTAAESDVDSAIFSGLTVLDDRGKLVPDLAQEVPSPVNGGISADGLTLIYLLRPGLHWQDGVALTADDVVFTFYAMHEPKTGVPLSPGYANVAGVEARDYETVVIHLKSRDANAVDELFVNGQGGSILPHHILGNVRNLRHSQFDQHPVGSGPYAVESWKRGTELRLRANHRYFQGVPAIEHLVVRFVPNPNAMVQQVRAGSLELGCGIDARLVPQLRQTAGLRVAQAPTYALAMLVDRVDAPQLSDARVRRALGRAVDRATIVRKAYLGFASPASELIPPWSPWSTARAIRPADLKTAGTLLDDAGWAMGPDRRREHGGQRLALTLTYQNGSRDVTTMATLLRAQWTALGIDVALRPVRPAALLGADGILMRGDFSVALTTGDFGAFPDRSALLGSSNVPPNGDNVARYSNGDVDQAIITANTSFDPLERKRALASIAARIATDAPYVPIVWPQAIYAISNRLDGVKPQPLSSDFWNVYAWRMR